MKRYGITTAPVLRTILFAIGLALLADLSSRPAHAQTSDVYLCDRLAAHPEDRDKPAEIKGSLTIAESDVAEAITFCRLASASSRASRRALFQLGRAYETNRQIPEASAAYRKAADKGSTAAMIELGGLLANGAGGVKDEEGAIKLFERAAQTGDARAMANLGTMYAAGVGVPVNLPLARTWFTKASEADSTEAMYQLGRMNEDGDGGPKNDVAARVLFEKASARSHPGALERMGAYARAGRGGPQDDKAAAAYYEKAVALGNQDAAAALQRMKCPYVLKDKRGGTLTNLCF